MTHELRSGWSWRKFDDGTFGARRDSGGGCCVYWPDGTVYARETPADVVLAVLAKNGVRLA